ncbi:MAG: hypothetical protein JJU19_00330 [Pararhodobacter sp.]|nr:hypothetical protein [Pararhodobacter sp.]
MAYITSGSAPATFRQITDTMLSRLGHGLEVYADRRARRAQVEFYESLNDAELAARGISRDDIVRHVFRDKLLSI